MMKHPEMEETSTKQVDFQEQQDMRNLHVWAEEGDNSGGAGQGQVRVLLGQDDLSMTDYKISVSFLFNSAKYHRTRFQLTLPVQSQNVTKNQTDHRTHGGGIQICQINSWNNSFQNMYSMSRQQSTVWLGKSILCKKTPQKLLFLCARIWVTWLWKDLDAKPSKPGQQLGWPWNLWGIMLQTSYVEGCWHQNWVHTSPLHFFIECARKFKKKSDFLGKTLCTRKFSTGKFFGASTHGILTYSGFRKCNCFGWPSLRFEVTVAQNEVIGQKLEVLQKIRGVTKI